MQNCNKCLSICEQVDVVEWNIRWPSAFPHSPMNCKCLWRKTTISKKQENITRSFLSIQLLKQVSQPFHLACNLHTSWLIFQFLKLSDIYIKNGQTKLNKLKWAKLFVKCVYIIFKEPDDVNTSYENLCSF